MASLTDQFLATVGTNDEIDACQRAVKRHFGDQVSSSASVDLEALASRKGIKVDRCVDLPFEGAIKRLEDGSAWIRLRSGQNVRRERFTLAHELGHWILQEEMLGTLDGQLFRGVSRDRDELREEERLANLLAAEILLPASFVEAEFGSDDSLGSLLRICRRAKVSRQMAIRRVADVLQANFVLLQVVPYLFRKPGCLAEVDDAVFTTARKGSLFDRKRTRFARKYRFDDLANSERVRLELESPKGSFSSEFQIDARPEPIPHAFALARVEEWSNGHGPELARGARSRPCA